MNIYVISIFVIGRNYIIIVYGDLIIICVF